MSSWTVCGTAPFLAGFESSHGSTQQKSSGGATLSISRGSYAISRMGDDSGPRSSRPPGEYLDSREKGGVAVCRGVARFSADGRLHPREMEMLERLRARLEE